MAIALYTKSPIKDESMEPFDALEKKILEYLHQLPNAVDTAEGIGLWWVKEISRSNDDVPVQSPQDQHHSISHALDNLVAAGLITKRKVPGGSDLFFLNKTHSN